MVRPLISVGLPVANETPDIVRHAVRSVVNQTISDWELIIVMDGDVHPPRDFLDCLGDPRIQIVQDGRRLGLAARLNQLASLARGELLARMDADDIMSPTRLERQAEMLIAEKLDVIGTRAFAVDESGNLLGALKEPPLPRTAEGFLANHAFTHPTVTGRTRWFRENPYRVDFMRAQDKELWVRTAGHSRFGKIEDRLLFYRLAGARSIARFRASYRYDRRILREYGPPLVGRLAVARRLGVSYAKEAVASTMMALDQGARLVSRKVEALSAEERLRASWLLDAAVNDGTEQ